MRKKRLEKRLAKLMSKRDALTKRAMDYLLNKSP